MKKLNIFILAIVCMMTTSCSDFLDVTPVGKVIPTTYEDFRALMTNAYERAGGLNGKSLSSIKGDEFVLIENKESSLHKDIYIWNDVNQDSKTRQFDWQQYYKTLMNVNHIIKEGADATKGNTQLINQLLAEAYLLRAYVHFDLVNLYADIYSAENLEKLAIPMSLEIDLEKDYKRNTIKDVYKQILSDIQSGLDKINVDKQDASVNYRFSKVSALGFAARVHLYMGEWDKATDYSKKALAIYSKLDVNSAIEYNSVENVLSMERNFDKNVQGTTYISDKVLNAFDKTNDARFNVLFVESTKVPGKYVGNIGGSELKNKLSMRTAEFYLMVAEAQAKSTTGDIAEAKKYLKDLLVTRFTPAYFATESAKIDAMDKATFIKKVEEERMKELACQGFRWFDLRRNGKPELKRTFEGKEYTLKVNDSRYIIPFPIEAIENNPNLKNN